MKKYLFAIFGLLFLQSCGSSNCKEDTTLKKKLVSRVYEARKSDTFLNFASTVQFEWDTIYILPPYTVLDHFHKSTGLDISCLNETGIQSRDDMNLIVFTKKSEIISYVNYSRKDGDFYIPNSKNYITHEDSNFNIINNAIMLKDSSNNYIIFHQ